MNLQDDEQPNIIDELKYLCAEAGTNLNQVCLATGTNRSVIERWKTDEPKAITVVRKMKEEIARLKAEKQA